MKAEIESVSDVQTTTPCGRCSCVIMYKGEHCIFCDPAGEMLQQTLSNYQVPSSAVIEVNVESDEDSGCCADDVSMLPTIRICDSLVTGLPDEQSLNDAVLRAIMKDCFCEHSCPTQSIQK